LAQRFTIQILETKPADVLAGSDSHVPELLACPIKHCAMVAQDFVSGAPSEVIPLDVVAFRAGSVVVINYFALAS
jgi:hypothetical protein